MSLTIACIVGHVCTPIFLAKVTVFACATLLGDAFVIERALAILVIRLAIIPGFSVGLPGRPGGFLASLDILKNLDRTT